MHTRLFRHLVPENSVYCGYCFVKHTFAFQRILDDYAGPDSARIQGCDRGPLVADGIEGFDESEVLLTIIATDRQQLVAQNADAYCIPGHVHGRHLGPGVGFRIVSLNTIVAAGVRVAGGRVVSAYRIETAVHDANAYTTPPSGHGRAGDPAIQVRIVALDSVEARIVIAPTHGVKFVVEHRYANRGTLRAHGTDVCPLSSRRVPALRSV